jgi:hypothetical protein
MLSRNSKDVGEHAGDFDVSLLQQFLHSVPFPRRILRELDSAARQITQLTNRFSGI